MREELVVNARNKTSVVNAEKFNAWAIEWDSKFESAKGHYLMQAMSSELQVVAEQVINKQR